MRLRVPGQRRESPSLVFDGVAGKILEKPSIPAAEPRQALPTRLAHPAGMALSGLPPGRFLVFSGLGTLWPRDDPNASAGGWSVEIGLWAPRAIAARGPGMPRPHDGSRRAREGTKNPLGFAAPPGERLQTGARPVA